MSGKAESPPPAETEDEQGDNPAAPEDAIPSVEKDDESKMADQPTVDQDLTTEAADETPETGVTHNAPEGESPDADREEVPAEATDKIADESELNVDKTEENEVGVTEAMENTPANVDTEQAENAPEKGTTEASSSGEKKGTTEASSSGEKHVEQNEDKSGNGTVGTETNETKSAEVDPHAVSPPPAVILDATATVKFVLMPSGQVATLACSLGQTLKQLKEHFAAELKMPASLILLMFDGKTMSDHSTLADLGVGPNGTVQLEMQSADPVNTPIKPYRPRQEYHMPDVITVRVQGTDGNYKDVVVEIERATKKKPYIGGYRHKKDGTEYHHASAQTMQKPKPLSIIEMNCRDTQTVQQRNQVQQTHNNMATQMTKIGVYVANMQDKLVAPGKYITADEHHEMILRQVVILQKNYRRWLAQRRVTKLKEEKQNRLQWERQEEVRKRKEKEDRIKQEFARRMNPKSKQDFDLLYHALEKWRQEELTRINDSLTGAERKAALCMLLDQETQLIASIGQHKLEADVENKEKRIQTFLNKASEPKKWKAFDGGQTEMDTPYTIRAKELRDIYNSINMKYLTQDERLDVLLTLKHTVKEHDCKLTQEVIELIDREADLLMRGVKESNLDGLRKRISTLFLQYIKTPTFNPEAAKLLKVPQDPSILRKNIYFCPSCNSYLPSTEFPLSSNSRGVAKCSRCAKLDNDARTRQDFSHFRYMLKHLRKSEESYGDGSKIAFLLQETDLRYLVENIWNCQSILSAWEDLYDLVLIRWDRNEEWSPWNCVLLTKDEAAAHDKLINLDEGYGQVFIQKIKHKHTLARNYFSRLPGMAEIVRTRANQKDMMGPSIMGKPVPVQSKA